MVCDYHDNVSIPEQHDGMHANCQSNYAWESSANSESILFVRRIACTSVDVEPEIMIDFLAWMLDQCSQWRPIKTRNRGVTDYSTIADNNDEVCEQHRGEGNMAGIPKSCRGCMN